MRVAPAPVEDEPIYHAPDDQSPGLSFPARNLPHIIQAILRQVSSDLELRGRGGLAARPLQCVSQLVPVQSKFSRPSRCNAAPTQPFLRALY